MSPPSDEITAPKDPAEYRPRPLMGATYWAMMALMVLCVLAGVAIAEFLPRMLARHAPATSTPAPAAANPEPTPSVPVAAAVAPPAPQPTASSPDVDRLSARVATLEQRQSGVSQAAAAALAAAAVVEA